MTDEEARAQFEAIRKASLDRESPEYFVIQVSSQRAALRALKSRVYGERYEKLGPDCGIDSSAEYLRRNWPWTLPGWLAAPDSRSTARPKTGPDFTEVIAQ